VVANFDATPNRDPTRATDLLVKQVDGPVRWEESIKRMAAEGVTHALEIGPGKVLAGLVKRIAKDIKVLSIGDAAGVREAVDFVKEAVG
jgi:[acyl-carrier-protein] S-malonyltransferase